MRKTKVIKVFNLVNSKGTKLMLQFGIITEGLRDESPFDARDNGYRWRFIGREIPMPVRSMCWFNGFPEETMLDWLKGNGWYPHTCVYMDDGSAKVYELPAPTEEYPDWMFASDERQFNKFITDMYRNGDKHQAVWMYRYAHECGTRTAVEALMDMCK